MDLDGATAALHNNWDNSKFCAQRILHLLLYPECVGSQIGGECPYNLTFSLLHSSLTDWYAIHPLTQWSVTAQSRET